MTEIGLLLTVIGAMPALIGVAVWLTRYRFARKILAFQPAEHIDVVITTTATHQNSRGVRRATTGIGQVAGIAAFARSLNHFYRRKPLKVHMSVRVTNRLDHDLLLLGGPQNNGLSRVFLEHVRASHQDIPIVFDDEQFSVQVGDFQITGFEPKIEDGVPVEDLALIMFERNPFAPEWRRAILCSGFTSYGTGAASEYLFQDLLGDRSRRFKRIERKWTSQCGFIMVVRLYFVGDQLVRVNEVKFIRL
jgi:hypothetical protein